MTCVTQPPSISQIKSLRVAKIEVCSDTAQHFSGPTHVGDPSAQTSEYSVTAPEGSQGSAVIMSEAQTLEVTPEHEGLESEVTYFQQPQTEQDQEDLHIDVVGIDDVEERTPEA